MNTLTSRTCDVFANRVSFGRSKIHVFLSDGRELIVPLEWFPRLRDASTRQREHWRLIAGGIGIHWDTIDEDISVAGLLR